MNTKEEFLKFLQKEKEEITNIQFSMNKDLVEKRMINITQRRDYFKHITILALGLSGIAFFTNKVEHYSYFIAGFILLISCIFLILVWLKEILDKESRGLESLQDKYNSMAVEKEAFISEFQKKFLERIHI